MLISLSFFVFFSVFFCYLSCLILDPIKRALFLVFSLIFFSPVLSFSNFVWFSYFVCLIFLSGVFVIIVYFSSISNFFSFSFSHSLIFFLITGFFFSWILLFYEGFVLLNSFYYFVFIGFFIWIILNLIFFLNFISYFLSFSGALRKVCRCRLILNF